MTRADRMRQILTEQFSPDALTIIDDSHKHKGHMGWREGGETHFTIEISAQSLRSQSRVAANQAIYRVLKPEFAAGLHALSIKIGK